MQKILLFVLVIFIVNVQSMVWTQVSVDKLLADAVEVAAAAKGKAAASHQADLDAAAQALEDDGLIGPEKTLLTADLLALGKAQDSYKLQHTATVSAQGAADDSRALLATAHANVEDNSLVVEALKVRKTAMTYTSTDLVGKHTALATAVGDAGTAITALQTQMTIVKTFITDQKTPLVNGLAAQETTMNNAKTAESDALTAMSGGGAGAVCKDTLVADYVTKAGLYITAGGTHGKNAAVIAAYTSLNTQIDTDLAAKITPLLNKQGAVVTATATLKINLQSGSSALSSIQHIIDNEQAKVNTALATAEALTLSLATALSNKNSLATESDSLWLAAQSLLATQENHLLEIASKTEIRQGLYDTRYGNWMKSQNAAYVAGDVMAVDAAHEKETHDMELLTKTVHDNVVVALTNDHTAAVAALEVVETKAASVTAAVAAKLKEVTDAATAAHAAGVTSLNAAVATEVTAEKAADKTLGTKWNTSLTADAVAAKATCAAEIKKAHDANKSSTKLNFSVLSLIAGLLIMTMN